MIDEGKTVAIEYSIILEDGSVYDSNVDEEPFVFRFGQGEILPALEEALRGMSPGEKATVVLEPEDAYGLIDPDDFQVVEPDKIPEELHEVGMALDIEDEDGEHHIVYVHEITKDSIVLNFNDPLAGHMLTFEVEILGVEYVRKVAHND